MTQVDFDFGHLRAIAGTLDALLDDVQREIHESPDPDSFGVFDRGEALIGLGFVACQNYLVARKKLRPKSTYDSGPLHSSQYYIARIINEGANYWKHHPEWPHDESQFSTFQQRTVNVLKDVGVWQHDYKLSNLLTEIASTMSFTSLLGQLDQWREALDPGGFIP